MSYPDQEGWLRVDLMNSQRAEAAPPRAPAGDEHQHIVQLYDTDAALAAGVASFLLEGLAAGEPAVVIATLAHREALAAALAAGGVDVPGETAAGRLRMLDASETLCAFMDGVAPDRRRFREHIGPAIRDLAALSRTGRVRAFGEMVDVLWRAGNPKGAIGLEELWGELQADHRFALYCAYRLDRGLDPEGLRQICGVHTQVIPPERAPAPDDRRDGAAAPPPPAELAVLTAEIARRKEVERTLRDSLRELRRAERAIRASQEDLADFLDNAPIAVHSVGPDGRVLWANRAELDLLGYAPEEYIGQSLARFHADPAVLDDILARLARHETLQDVPARLRAKDGSIVHVLISSNARWEGDELVHTRCFSRDVTHQRRLESGREVASRRGERLLAITAAMARAVTPEEVHAAIVDQVAAALDASTAGLWLLAASGDSLQLLRQVGYSDVIDRFDGVPVNATWRFPALDALAGEPLWIRSQEELISRYPHLAAAVTAGRSYQIACLPITVQGTTRGALAFTFVGAPPLDEDQRSFLLLVARYSSQALERLHLLEEERRSRAVSEEVAGRMAVVGRENEIARMRAELLYRLTRSVIDAGSIDAVYDAALRAIQQALATTRASILVTDAAGVMRFVAQRGLSEEYRAAVEGHSPWDPGDPAPSPILIADAAADEGLADFHALFRAEGIAALAFFPLTASGRLLGKFMVYYDHPRVLSPSELDLATAIANHVGAAVERFSAVAELEETVRFNEMFTGILGHDLRNPLGAIMTAAQVMLRRAEGDRERRPLERILGSGERMSRMIDQLLDFTRVRVGAGIPLQPVVADLVPLMQQVLDELDGAAAGPRFEIETAGDTRGVWDVDRLCQVFSNLGGNALQHGEGGGPVQVRIDGTEPDLVRVEVRNAGAIPADLLPRLFEPMTAGDRRRDRSHGLGLGLFISREIARSHGGDIQVSSSPAGGTRFEVTLPRVAVAG